MQECHSSLHIGYRRRACCGQNGGWKNRHVSIVKCERREPGKVIKNEWDCSRIKIRHLGGNVSLTALALLVNEYFHMCEGEVRLGT
jgi:hypothetical protein